jgi:hypothetical protein
MISGVPSVRTEHAKKWSGEVERERGGEGGRIDAMVRDRLWGGGMTARWGGGGRTRALSMVGTCGGRSSGRKVVV